MTHPRQSLCTPSAGTGGRTCPEGLLPHRRRRRLCRCRGRSEGTPRGGDTHRSRSRPARRRRPPRPCGRHGAGGERGRRTPRLCSRCPPASPRPAPLARPSPRGDAPGRLRRGWGARGSATGVSPGVLELDEGEGRAPAAVLQVDVADGAVLVEHVLDVLGADVGGQVPHVDAAVVVAGRAADDAAAGHGEVGNVCGGAGRCGAAVAGPGRALGALVTSPDRRFKMAPAAPLALPLRAPISPRDAAPAAAPPALTADQQRTRLPPRPHSSAPRMRGSTAK